MTGTITKPTVKKQVLKLQNSEGNVVYTDLLFRLAKLKIFFFFKCGKAYRLQVLIGNIKAIQSEGY